MSNAEIAFWTTVAVLTVQFMVMPNIRHRISPRTNNLSLAACGATSSAACFVGALDFWWLILPGLYSSAAAVWVLRKERIRAARQNG